MHTYIIAYDLTHKPEAVYNALIQTLEAAGAKRAQKSVWVHDSPYGAKQNYEWLQPHLKEGDQLLVIEVNPSNSWITVDTTSFAAFVANDNIASVIKLLLALGGKSK